jgi:hypothetical protein
MLPHKRLLLVCITWLTAAATLFAELPQTACLCASAATESPTSASVPQTATCCCGHGGTCGHGDGCCRQIAPKAATTSCCGQAKTDQGPDQRIGRTPCSRGLVHSTQTTIISAPTDSKLSIASAATIGATPVLVPARKMPTARSAPARALAPPVDLVCLLQHLLI